MKDVPPEASVPGRDHQGGSVIERPVFIPASLLLLGLVCGCRPQAACGDDCATQPARLAQPRASATASGEVVKLSTRDAGAAVHLWVGQALRVELDTSPASGYTWELDGDLPPGLRMETDPGAKPMALAATGPDDGINQTWSFRAIRPGHARLRFLYRRAWEDADHSTRSAIFDVGVSQPP